MKSVLLSIQPQWCELIASGKKMIEVRKTRPKIETPFKCYIYCSKGKTFLYKNPNNGELFLDSNGGYRGGDYEDRFLTGKVIGSFVCDKKYNIFRWGIGVAVTNEKNEIMPADILRKGSCLSDDEICDYVGNGEAYGWHITEPKLFDKPKELSEFGTVCNRYENDECDDCPYLQVYVNSYPCDDCVDTWCGVDNIKPLTRPPMSWCYVEEFE